SKRDGDPASDLALVVTYAPVLDKEQMQVLLLDLKQMAALYTQASRRESLSDEQKRRLQDKLFEVGVMTKPPVVRYVASTEEIETFVNDLFGRVFKKLFRRRGFRRFGQIDVRGPKGGVLFVDGQSVGRIDEETASIKDISAGEHLVRIEHPDYLAYEEAVEVESFKSIVFSPNLVRSAQDTAYIARTTLFWTGIATAAAGVGVIIATAAQESNDLLCTPRRPPECQDENRFRELGPVLGLPLGYSLIAAGGIWSTASALNGESESWPWWEFAVGAAVAGAAYGVSAAVNPPPFNDR
ncbi:MAG: hypothetical protein AAFV29_24210, partial [Myxococcota bacterium]